MPYSFLVSKKYEDVLIKSLRYSIAIIFIWFGLLKVAGYNPVFDLVQYSMMPPLASGAGLIALGIFETLIGILLFTNKFLLMTHTFLFCHLLGTFSTFIFGWHVVFSPHFPILSLGGEFVMKNLTLVVAALVVLVHEERRLLRNNT